MALWNTQLWTEINNFKIDSGGKCSVEICSDEKWKSFDMVSTCDFGILAISWNILWGLSLCRSESFKWKIILIKVVCLTHRDLTSYNAWTNRTKMRTVFEKNQINKWSRWNKSSNIFGSSNNFLTKMCKKRWAMLAKCVGNHSLASFIGKRRMCR